MVTQIISIYKSEGIEFLYETDEFLSDWDNKIHTDKFSCNLKKYVWNKDQFRYELICHTIMLDGYSCHGNEGNGPYYNDMSDTPTGKKIIDEMKSYFTI